MSTNPRVNLQFGIFRNSYGRYPNQHDVFYRYNENNGKVLHSCHRQNPPFGAHAGSNRQGKMKNKVVELAAWKETI
jgi:hypothetical protein